MSGLLFTGVAIYGLGFWYAYIFDTRNSDLRAFSRALFWFVPRSRR